MGTGEQRVCYWCSAHVKYLLPVQVELSSRFLKVAVELPVTDAVLGNSEARKKAAGAVRLGQQHALVAGIGRHHQRAQCKARDPP